jgi:adenylate cyclase
MNKVFSFTLHSGERSLRAGPREVHLRPKVFETLLFLIERHGHLVKKEELLSGLWPDVIVTDNTLNKGIEELRHVLEDNPQKPRLIQEISSIRGGAASL